MTFFRNKALDVSGKGGGVVEVACTVHIKLVRRTRDGGIGSKPLAMTLCPLPTRF